MGVKSFDDLIVWQKSMDLAANIHQVVSRFPKHETYALAHQLRRASVSVPSNIAEGQQRQSRREFLNFLTIARGSLAECQTQVLLAKRFAYIDEITGTDLLHLIADTGRLLNALIKSLQPKADDAITSH